MLGECGCRGGTVAIAATFALDREYVQCLAYSVAGQGAISIHVHHRSGLREAVAPLD
jgi:hypothetical protein